MTRLGFSRRTWFLGGLLYAGVAFLAVLAWFREPQPPRANETPEQVLQRTKARSADAERALETLRETNALRDRLEALEDRQRDGDAAERRARAELEDEIASLREAAGKGHESFLAQVARIKAEEAVRRGRMEALIAEKRWQRRLNAVLLGVPSLLLAVVAFMRACGRESAG